MGSAMRVISRPEERRPQTAMEAAYDEFRLDRMAELVSARTLDHYDHMVLPFFAWLYREHPEVTDFIGLDVKMVRRYKRWQAIRPGRHGRALEPAKLLDFH